MGALVDAISTILDFRGCFSDLAGHFFHKIKNKN